MNDSITEETLTTEAPTSRRRALRTLGKLGMGAAAAVSVTSFFGARPRKVFAQSAPSPLNVLNYALTLEYLEMYFYQKGTDMIVPGGNAMETFELIQEHEEKHVNALTAIIKSLGEDPVEFEMSDFDFTARGTFDPFNDYPTFLTLSQGFEDTGVRAYKGQAPNLIGNKYLTAALQIHAVEARHAAKVRRIRGEMGVDVEPWIELDGGTDGTALEAIYGAGDPPEKYPPEENVTQAGVDLTTLGDYSAEEASAAFDEPLDMGTVKDIADPFTKNDLDGDGDKAS